LPAAWRPRGSWVAQPMTATPARAPRQVRDDRGGVAVGEHRNATPRGLTSRCGDRMAGTRARAARQCGVDQAAIGLFAGARVRHPRHGSRSSPGAPHARALGCPSVRVE
jgi:hypothetical protein